MEDEARLETLEIKMSYQDDTLRQLNDVVVRQQQEINTLEHLTQQLLTRVRDLSLVNSGTVNDFSVAEERPPHY